MATLSPTDGGWRLTAWAAAVFAVTLGFSRLSYGLLVPALQATFGGTIPQYGVIGTLNFVGYLLGTLAVPALLARFPSAGRLNLLSGLLLALSIGASALSAGLVALGGWRLLIGFASAPATVLTLTLTLERVPAAARGRVSGLVWGGGAGGIALSGLVAPLVLDGPPEGWRWTWLVMGCLGLVAALGFSRALGGGRASRPRAPAERAGRRDASRGTFWHAVLPLAQPQQLLLLVLAYAGFGAGYIIYFTYIVAALAEQGVSSLSTGWIWGALGLTGMLSGVLWGWAIDRWPSGWTLAATLAAGAVGASMVFSGSTLLVGAGAGLVGLTAFIGPALIVTALLRRAVAAEAYAACLSVTTGLFAGGQIVGPLLGAWVGQLFGLTAGVGVSAALLTGAAMLAGGYGWVHRRREEGAP